MNPPQRTPLYARHLELGARMTDFAGFLMPIQYGSIKTEHATVRQQAGLFDVSHMGQIQVQGPSAAACLESLLTCRVNDLVVGCVRYGLLCNEMGGCLDDVTLYRDATDSFLLCVNAANIDRDFQWLRAHAPAHCEVLDLSRTTALLALQGPQFSRHPGLDPRSSRHSCAQFAETLPVRQLDLARESPTDLADRLHRSGRLRNLPGGRLRPLTLRSAARKRRVRRPPTRRPGSTGYTPSRSRPPPVRP